MIQPHIWFSWRNRTASQIWVKNFRAVVGSFVQSRRFHELYRNHDHFFQFKGKLYKKFKWNLGFSSEKYIVSKIKSLSSSLSLISINFKAHLKSSETCRVIEQSLKNPWQEFAETPLNFGVIFQDYGLWVSSKQLIVLHCQQISPQIFPCILCDSLP